jgi:transcriptional regulator with XRE-family HTH domain
VTDVADRLRIAMEAAAISQSRLARDIGATQGAISLILLGKTTNSRLLPKIATRLGVSLAWLLGMVDDPCEGGGPDVLEQPQIMLPVRLPSENALADMFEGLLLTIHQLGPLSERRVDELARELAQLLPTGLSQLQGRLFELPRPPRQSPTLVEAKPGVLANTDREPPR